jgi:hypothetical protein
MEQAAASVVLVHEASGEPVKVGDAVTLDGHCAPGARSTGRVLRAPVAPTPDYPHGQVFLAVTRDGSCSHQSSRPDIWGLAWARFSAFPENQK